MTARERLPNRRRSESFSFECSGLRFSATASWYDDGRLGEVFVGNCKVDSQADSVAKDSAVVCSIALQYGVPVETIRQALLQDSRGVPSSPLGVALHIIAGTP